MQKTITIDNKEVSFKANASFYYIYKNQFGVDILTVIMPLISEVLKNADDFFASAMSSKQGESEEQKTTITILPSELGTLIESVYSIEIVDLQNIIWAMAKTADANIKEPILWYQQFDEFPIFEIAKELVSILIPSLVSKKKLEMLKNWAKKGK